MKCKLKDFCTVINGRAYSQKELLDKGKYRVLRVGNFFSSDRWYFSDLELSAEKYCNKGDLLFAWACSFGPRIWDGEGRTIFHYHIWKLDIDSAIVDKKYLYYLLKISVDSMTAGTHGSVMMHITKSDMENFEFDIPTLEVQKKIAAILSALDKKIAINRAINDNLEQQATALFESWFVNYDPWGGIQPSAWTNAPLGTFVEIKRGGSPRPIQDYLSDSGLRWLKISDVTSLSSPFVLEVKEHIKKEGLKKTVFLHAGELVLSNSATPGIPKILDVDTCIHDGWLYFPKSELSKYYLYLFFKHIRKELVSLGNGSVFTNLKTDILKAFPTTKADKVTLKKFDALVSPLFDAMLNADRENLKLATMRDSLLPKLMSGEIDVSAVQL